jgi:hypothetical protein
LEVVWRKFLQAACWWENNNIPREGQEKNFPHSAKHPGFWPLVKQYEKLRRGTPQEYFQNIFLPLTKLSPFVNFRRKE